MGNTLHTNSQRHESGGLPKSPGRFSVHAAPDAGLAEGERTSVRSPGTFKFRRFRVECECDGAPFVWEGDAIDDRAAITCAAYDLGVRFPEVVVSRIRATVCIEVSA
jgi:hypothetical protein